MPPPGHTGPRINIQIAPDVAAPVVAAEAAPRPARNTELDTSWFWEEIAAALPADRGRFWRAHELLSAAPQTGDIPVPRLSDLNDMAARHGRTILAESVGTSVSPALVLSVMAVESSGRAQVVSAAGAQGLMQLIPDTAARFGVTDAFDPGQNIAGGVAYLDWLMTEFQGDAILALAAYNAGEGAVRRAGGVPDYPETRAYVPKVLAAWAVARTLCLSPPDLPSDGCVFRIMD